MGYDFNSRLSNASTTLLDDDYFSRRDSLQLIAAGHISSNRNIGKVIYMSICFLILFTGFTSIQNLMSEIYDQLGHDSLGQITLLTLYGFFGISVLIVPSLLEYCSHKKGIVLGSLTYVFPVIAGALTTECTANSDRSWCGSKAFIYTSNIISASITGFGAAIIWLSVNRYITACASESNKGRFMGVFFSFFSCSNVLGNLIAAFILENFGQFAFYITTSIFIGIAVIMICFAREVPKYDEETSEESVKEKAAKVIRLAFSPRMRILLPYLFFVGLVLAIYSGFEFRIITHLIPDSKNEHQDFITAMVFLAQGVMSIVSSYSAGKLGDILARQKALTIFSGCFVLAIIFSFVAYFSDCLALIFIMGILWGMGYAGASTLTGVIMAKDFYGSIEAYAVLQLTTNIATITGFILCICIRDVTIFLFTILGFLVLSLVSASCYRAKDTTSPLGIIHGEYESE